MTLGDAGVLESSVFGIAVDLPTTSPVWHKEVQRAEGNGSGAPVGGTEVILATVRGEVTRFVDRGAQEPLDATKTYLYRYRLTRVGSQDGTWSGWSAEMRPTDLTGQVVLPESAPPVTVSLSLDESTGQVRMRVGTSLGIQSLRYATSTTDYPTNDTTHGSGTVVDTDAEGDADVDPVATLTREQTLYVTVLLYHQLSGSGSYVATARQSVKYGVSEGRDPADQSTVNLLGEDAGPEHSGTGSPVAYRYDGFGVPAAITLDALEMEPGDTISFAADLKSDTGTDTAQVAVAFYDATDTLISNALSAGVNSSSYQRDTKEGVTIPANTAYFSFFSRNPDGTEAVQIRRAMLNRGPVAAPYTDPPPVDGENLLPFTALGEESDTSAFGLDYLQDALLSDLGLEVGDVLSARVQLKSDTGADRIDLFITARDASGTIETFTGNVVQSSTYEDSVLHGMVIPAGADRIRYEVRNQDTTETHFARRAMLNRGPRAAPFQPPNFKELLDDAFSILRQLSGAGATIGDAIQQLRDDGHLNQGTQIDLGGVLWNLTRGRQDGSAPDADGGANNATVTFPTAYPATPKVTIFGSQGLGYDSGLGSTATQHRVMKPDTLDNQGFEMIGVLQDRSAQSLQTDTFPAGTLTVQGDALSLAGQTEGQNGGTGLTSDAVDDSYTTEFNVNLQVTDGGSSGTFTFSTLSVTVAVDKWDSNDAVWQEAGTIGYVLSAEEGGSDSINRNDVIEFSDSGVVGSDDIRVRVKSVAESCGSAGCTSSVTVDPVEATYNVAGVSEATMSPNGEKLAWAARQEVT